MASEMASKTSAMLNSIDPPIESLGCVISDGSSGQSSQRRRSRDRQLAGPPQVELARRSALDLVDGHDPPRDLERRQLAPTVGDEVVLVDDVAGAHLEERGDPLAPP